MTPAEKGFYPIRGVEKRTGLSARQIRYYESMGLVSPTRTNGGQRRYSEKDVLRLIHIKQMRESGFSLKSIKEKIQVFERNLEEFYLSDVNDREVLSSLFPVSNRAVLMKLLEKK